MDNKRDNGKGKKSAREGKDGQKINKKIAYVYLLGRNTPQMVTISPGVAILVRSPLQVTVRPRGMLPTGT
jgi:hypothetical protein